MGWITGVMVFVILAVLLTAALFALNRGAGGGFAALRDQMNSVQHMSQEEFDKAAATLQSPAGIVQLLAFFFVFMTLVPTLGGALGAKLLSKD